MTAMNRPDRYRLRLETRERNLSLGFEETISARLFAEWTDEDGRSFDPGVRDAYEPDPTEDES